MSAVPKPRQQMRMMIVDDSNVMRRRIERSQQNDQLEVVGYRGELASMRSPSSSSCCPTS